MHVTSSVTYDTWILDSGNRAKPRASLASRSLAIVTVRNQCIGSSPTTNNNTTPLGPLIKLSVIYLAFITPYRISYNTSEE